MSGMSFFKKIVWIIMAAFVFIWMLVSTIAMVMTQNIWWITSACGSLIFEISWMDYGFDDYEDYED